MTLSNGQALAGAHIPTLVPVRESREAAAERLDATTRSGEPASPEHS
jgi:hypothetical protein